MSLPEKGQPVPADVAAIWLRDVAGALRDDADNPEYLKRAFAGRYREAPLPHERESRAGMLDTAGQDYALRLAADVLEAIADGKRDLGRLIRRTGKALIYFESFNRVNGEITLARHKGESITLTEACKRVADRIRAGSEPNYLDTEKVKDENLEKRIKDYALKCADDWLKRAGDRKWWQEARKPGRPAKKARRTG